MNIESYIEDQRSKCNGKSFTVMAERCETSIDAPYRIRKALDVKRDEVAVLCLAGGGGNKIDLRGYNSFLRDVDDFVKKECKNKIRVVVACSEFGKFHDARLARKALHVAAAWPDHYEALKKGVGEKYYAETFTPQYVRDIFDSIIEPRICDENGQRFKLSEALRYARKVNVVSHCHGGYVAMILEDMMTKRMNELGYSNSEQEKIKSQVLVLGYNPDCPHVISRFKFIGFVSSQDSCNMYNNYMKEWLLMTPHYFGVGYMPKKWGRTLICDMVSSSWGAVKEINDASDLFVPKGGVNEHEFIGFEPKKGMSASGLLMQRLGGNVLVNGVYNSLKQDEKFVSIPNIEKLIVRNFNDRVDFAKACIIGFRLEKKLDKVDKQKIDQFADWRRSLPVIELD